MLAETGVPLIPPTLAEKRITRIYIPVVFWATSGGISSISCANILPPYFNEYQLGFYSSSQVCLFSDFQLQFKDHILLLTYLIIF